MPYNLGHAVFEFIEAKFGKEGVRQFVFSLRKSVIGGGEDAYEEALKMKKDEFDQAFERYLKERFKPFRDKERPADYGRDLSPNKEKTPFAEAISIAPSPSGDLIAVTTFNRKDREIDVILVSSKDGSIVRNLTKGFDKDMGFDHIVQNGERFEMPWMTWSPKGDRLAYFVRTEKERTLIIQNVLTRKVEQRIDMKSVDEPESPSFSPDGKTIAFSGAARRRRRHLHGRSRDGSGHQPHQRQLLRRRPDVLARRQVHHLQRARQRQPEAVPPRSRHEEEDADHVRHGRRNGRAVHRRPHDRLLVDGHRSERAARAGRRAQRQHLQHLDARPEERRAAPVHRRARRQLVGRSVLNEGQTNRIAFVSYYKGDYTLHTLERKEPLHTAASADFGAPGAIIDFQAPLQHTLVADNMRKKKTFEKMFLEGRPPVNVGVTNSGDIFGGTAVTFGDVLGDKQFNFTAASIAQYRTFALSYVNIGQRFQYALQGYSQTLFYYGQLGGLFYDPAYAPFISRDQAQSTQTIRGGSVIGIYPLDRFHRVEVSGGFMNIDQSFNDPDLEQAYPTSTSSRADRAQHADAATAR